MARRIRADSSPERPPALSPACLVVSWIRPNLYRPASFANGCSGPLRGHPDAHSASVTRAEHQLQMVPSDRTSVHECQDIGDSWLVVGWRRAECRGAAPPNSRVVVAITVRRPAAALDSGASAAHGQQGAGLGLPQLTRGAVGPVGFAAPVAAGRGCGRGAGFRQSLVAAAPVHGEFSHQMMPVEDQQVITGAEHLHHPAGEFTPHSDAQPVPVEEAALFDRL